MGCSESKLTEEQWRAKTEQYEANFLETIGWKKGEYVAKYTTIQKNGKPYLVRTFYFGCEDKSKKTLVLTHGFMGNMVSFAGILKKLSERYRVIAFDNLGWGLNTRIPDYWNEVDDLEKSEAWILDFYEQVINGLDDCPEQFYLSGHSMGGYHSQFYASQHPERIEKLFLLDPAGTEGLDPAKNDPANTMHADEPWRRYTKDEAKTLGKQASNLKRHYMQDLHDMPGCAKDMILKDICTWLHQDLKKQGFSQEACKAWDLYYFQTLIQPSFTDNLQQCPFVPVTPYLKNPLIKENRLGNPDCKFPIAYAFGDQSFLSSELGAEEILELKKQHNDGQISLYKINKAGHNIMSENMEETFANMTAFFDGKEIGIWQPTKKGDYQWHGEKPKKGYVPREQW